MNADPPFGILVLVSTFLVLVIGLPMWRLVREITGTGFRACNTCKKVYRLRNMFVVSATYERYCLKCLERHFKEGRRIAKGYLPWLLVLVLGVFVVGGGLSTAFDIPHSSRIPFAFSVGLVLTALSRLFP